MYDCAAVSSHAQLHYEHLCFRTDFTSANKSRPLFCSPNKPMRWKNKGQCLTEGWLQGISFIPAVLIRSPNYLAQQMKVATFLYPNALLIYAYLFDYSSDARDAGYAQTRCRSTKETRPTDRLRSRLSSGKVDPTAPSPARKSWQRHTDAQRET